MSIGKNKGSPRGRISTLVITLPDSRGFPIRVGINILIISIEVPKTAPMSLKFFRKEQKVHNCPICGEKTEGSYSEGGIQG